MLINKGEKRSFLLKSGSVVTLSSGGMIGDSEKNSSVVSTDYDYKYGPFNIDKNVTLAAVESDVTYSVSGTEFQSMGYIECLNSELPILGKTGVIYFTEAGPKYFSDITGQYLALNVAPSLPVLAESGDPALSCDGEGVEDNVVTCTTGTWLYRPTDYSYQWYRGVAAISGETASTHTIVAADIGEDLTCEVTASNIVGSAETSATSDIFSVPAGE